MNSATTSDLADLKERLKAVENERSILQTLHRFGHSMDWGLEKEWVDCFTEDGVFEVLRPDGSRSRGGEGSVGLAAFIADHIHKPDGYHKHWKHLLIEPVITVDGNQATVISYFARVGSRESAPPVVWAFGRYSDRMVKCPDNLWRFKERRLELGAAPLLVPLVPCGGKIQA